MTKCKLKGDQVKKIYIFNTSDLTLDKEGQPRMKRKYGKFKRIGYPINAKKA